jgi:hypothetical protein
LGRLIALRAADFERRGAFRPVATLREKQARTGTQLACILPLKRIASRPLRGDVIRRPAQEGAFMIQPVKDHGQQLPVPVGKTIGFVDTEIQLDAITRALNEAGYPDSAISSLHGHDGIDLLERLRDVAFFGDWERAVADKGIAELEEGHYTFAVAVHNRDEALKIADLVEPYGGHSINYFGNWINEQLTK